MIISLVRMESISLEERVVTNLTAYKILGSPWSISKISETLREITSRDMSGSHDKSQPSDWAALYLQFRVDHVLGTLPYRWEPKSYTWESVESVSYQEAALIRVSFTAPLCVVVMRGALLSDGSLSGKDKADIIKKELGIPLELPLMDGMGERGKCAAVEETEGEWELVIPHSLLRNIQVQEEELVQFMKHAQFPVTKCWRDVKCGGGWLRFDQEKQDIGGIRDIEPIFL